MHKAVTREYRRLKRAANKASNRQRHHIERAMKSVVRQYDMAVNNAK